MSRKKKSYNHFNLCHKLKKFKEENEICLDFTFRNNQFISAKRFHESMSPIQISSSHPIPFEEKVNISIKPKSLKSLIIPSPLVLNIKKGNNEELLLNDISLKNYSSTNSEENGNEIIESFDNKDASNNNNDDCYYIDENNFIIMKEGANKMTILDILERNSKEITLSNL